MRPFTARALGLCLGIVADLALGDPRRAHPVSVFGRAAAVLDRRFHADSRRRGAAYAAVCVGSAVAIGAGIECGTRRRPAARVLLTATATWVVLGGTSLAREGEAMASLLAAGELEGADGARARLSHLCARDASALDAAELARASVESLAENLGDAVVAPLAWGVVAGAPGLLGYRAVNTLDAMVGYRSARYRRFGWASARLDDAANLVPARLAALLVAACAGAVGGSPRRALTVMRRDGRHHPSPNAGRIEAAAAGALEVTLGGSNTYHGDLERRPTLGGGWRAVEPGDVPRAVRLVRLAGGLAGLIAVGAAGAVAAWNGRRNEHG